MAKKIKLALVSTNRADEGHLRPLFEAACADKRFDATFCYGKPHAALDPDVIFVQGDRTELLSVCAAAIERGYIIAHAAGGERTRGSTDDRVRDAITKLAHLHYPVHETAKHRLLDFQEEEWRIRVVGEIGVDTIVNNRLVDLPKEIDAKRGDVIVAIHPVTARPQETVNVLNVAEDLIAHSTTTIWLVQPNGDPGAPEIMERYARLCKVYNAKLLPSLTQPQFCKLMSVCGIIIGNSSCLITEAPHLDTFTVLIGSRQEGRFTASSTGNACARILDHLHSCVTGVTTLRVKN